MAHLNKFDPLAERVTAESYRAHRDRERWAVMNTSSWGIAGFAWRQVGAVLTRFPLLVLSVFVLMFAVALLNEFFQPSVFGIVGGWVGNVGGMLISGLPNSVLQAAITAPLAMATHRMVILGEERDHAIWKLPQGFWRFLLWILIVNYSFQIAAIPLAVSSLVTQSATKSILKLVAFILYVPLMIFVVRSGLIFPAVAVGDPLARFGKTWRDSRGHWWKMFWALLLVLLPIYVAVSILLFSMLSGELGQTMKMALITYGAHAGRIADRNYPPPCGARRSLNPWGDGPQ